MLHLLRKHQYGILLVVAVIVIIAFAFLYDPNFSAGGRGGPQMQQGESLTVLGTTFAPEEVSEMESTFQALREISLGFGDPAMMHLMTMATLSQQFVEQDRGREEIPKDYLINVAILRAKAREFGIHPGEAAIEAQIQQLPRFQTNGKFDPQKWTEFKNAYGGSGGARMRQVYAAVGDMVRYEKLSELVGQPLPPSRAEIDWAYALRHQKVHAHVVPFRREDFANQEVTAEEVQKYFDENKESPALQTDEKRVLKYAVVARPPEADLKDLGEEEKAQKLKAYKLTAKKIADGLAEENPKPFDEIAADAGVEARTTEPVSQGAVPDELKSRSEVVEQAFGLMAAGEAEVLASGEDYVAVKVEEVQPPQPMDLEAARPKIEQLLREQKQTEKFNEAVKAAREKITAELAAGKSIEEAAQAAGVQVRALPVFSQSRPLQDEPHFQQVRAAAGTLNAGELSDPLNTADGQILVYVARKELPKDPKMEDQKKSLETEMGFAAQNPQANPLFRTWFADLKRQAVREISGS